MCEPGFRRDDNGWGECASVALCTVVNDLLQLKYANGLDERRMQQTVADEYQDGDAAAAYPGDLARRLNADAARFFRAGERNQKKWRVRLKGLRETKNFDALCARLGTFAGVHSAVVVYADPRSPGGDERVTHAVAAMGFIGRGDSRVVRARNSWGAFEPIAHVSREAYRYHVVFDPVIVEQRDCGGGKEPVPPVSTHWPGRGAREPAWATARAETSERRPDGADPVGADPVGADPIGADPVDADPVDAGRAEDECRLGLEAEDAFEAASYFWRSAVRGNDDAACNLGFAFHSGRGVPKDEAAAVRWWTRAAKNGHRLAQSNLGFCYDAGRGVGRDPAQALRWYHAAARGADGLPEAQTNVGRLHYVGDGVERDYAAAVSWYRRAAAQGHPTAQCNLGHCCEHGHGVERASWAEARAWWEKAAAQGNAEALFALGRYWDGGRQPSGERDAARATACWRRAAERGHAGARARLARRGGAGDLTLPRADRGGTETDRTQAAAAERTRTGRAEARGGETAPVATREGGGGDDAEPRTAPGKGAARVDRAGRRAQRASGS
jgi:TPR repeat protein